MTEIPSWIRSEYTYKKQVSRRARGRAATFVQEWLSLNGHSIQIDGDFGPATQAAVKQFQTSHGLSDLGSR